MLFTVLLKVPTLRYRGRKCFEHVSECMSQLRVPCIDEHFLKSVFQLFSVVFTVFYCFVSFDNMPALTGRGNTVLSIKHCIYQSPQGHKWVKSVKIVSHFRFNSFHMVQREVYANLKITLFSVKTAQKGQFWSFQDKSTVLS